MAVTDRLTEDADFGKKNHLFRWSSFWFWRVCKQAKLSYWGHRKPTSIHWKDDAPKRVPVWSGFWFRGIIGSFFFENEQARGRYSQWRLLSDYVERILFIKIAEEDIGNIWFQQDDATWCTAKATLDVLRPVLMIALSAAELMSFGHLGAAIWQRWTIIFGLPSKISATLTSQRQLTL